MPAWKDKITLKTESLKLALEQTGFSFGSFLKEFPPRKRMALLIMTAAIIPTAVLFRIGSQLLEQQVLKSRLVTAHQSYTQPQAPQVGPVTVINSGNGIYAAYVQVYNQNLDLAAANIPYQFTFYNSSHEQVATTKGNLFLLPDQKKYLVVPRLASKEVIVSAELVLQEANWQKRLTIPEVSLKTATPFISTQVNPLTLVAQGAVVNGSPYQLASVRLVFLVYDKQGAVIAVSQRDEFSIPAFGRRDYRQTWPNIYSETVGRIEVIPDTNALDGNNILLDRQSPAPGGGG